jgi:probable phosphoglycerate mutase
VTRFLLLRHGESEWNALGVWQGWADPDLSPLGRRQAVQAGHRLVENGHHFAEVISSDLRRSLATAEILAGRIGLDRPVPVPGLREFDVGEWSGLKRAEIDARWPGDLEKWRQGVLEQIPGGETRAEFTARIFAALVTLARRDDDRAVLAVTHGGVIRMIERTIGAPVDRERLTNLRGRWFEVDGDGIEPGPEVVLLDPELDSPPIAPVPASSDAHQEEAERASRSATD